MGKEGVVNLRVKPFSGVGPPFFGREPLPVKSLDENQKMTGGRSFSIGRGQRMDLPVGKLEKGAVLAGH